MKLTKKYKVRAKGTVATDENGDTLFVLDPETKDDEFITMWHLPPWDNPWAVPKGDVEWI
jgi:hypothetical protein